MEAIEVETTLSAVSKFRFEVLVPVEVVFGPVSGESRFTTVLVG